MWIELVLLISLWRSIVAYSPQLRRSIEKSGFHRELSTDIQFLKTSLYEGETEDITCTLLFSEVIPSGAYIDPYQIASLKSFGGPDALIKDKVDIEKPEYLSQPHTVEIFSRLHSKEKFWLSNYSLPVHLRYHATSDVEEFANVTFTPPEVAIRCWTLATGQPLQGNIGSAVGEKSASCSSDSQELCNWTVLETTVVCDDQLIVFEELDSYLCQQDNITVRVPVGRTNDYHLVTGVTLLFTISGCLIMVCYIIKKDQKKKVK